MSTPPSPFPLLQSPSQGDIPKARVAHSCSLDPVKGDIYVWGGFTGELSRLADFYVYNCETSFWTRLHPNGTEMGPPARAFHSAVFHNGALYLFSGANGDIRYNDVWRYQVRDLGFQSRGRFLLLQPAASPSIRSIVGCVISPPSIYYCDPN